MKLKLVVLGVVAGLVTIALLTGCAPSAPQQTGPIVLDVVAYFPKGQIAVAPHLYFIEQANKRAVGRLVLNWKGGPEVIPAFDQPEALIKGVIPVNAGTPNYYGGVVPAGDILDLCTFSSKDMGPGTELYEYMVKIYAEKGIRWVGGYPSALGQGGWFYFSRKPIQKPEDFAGLKIRVAPMTRKFTEALKGEPITMPGGEIYLAMERGTIDAFTWPLWDSFSELGFPQVTKYTVDHQIYRGFPGMLVNLEAWNKLPKDLQQLLLDVQVETQTYAEGLLAGQHMSQKQRAEKAGVKFVKFSDADAARFIKLSHDALWADFQKKLSPERYTKLRQLLKYE